MTHPRATTHQAATCWSPPALRQRSAAAQFLGPGAELVLKGEVVVPEPFPVRVRPYVHRDTVEPPNHDQSAPPLWPHCAHGADPAADPVGCRGIHVPGHTACLAHLADADRDAYLANLTAGASIDHRGTTFTSRLLNSLFHALRDSTTGHPHFGIAEFAEAAFEGDAGFGAATFESDAFFGEATFSGDASFGQRPSRATPSSGKQPSRATPCSWIRPSRPTPSSGGDVHGDASFGRATFSGDASFGVDDFRAQRLVRIDDLRGG